MASKKSTTKKSATSKKMTNAVLQEQVAELKKENVELEAVISAEVAYSNIVGMELEKFVKGLVMTAFALGKIVEEHNLVEKVAKMLKEAREEPLVANWAIRKEVHFFADGMEFLFTSIGTPQLSKNAPIEMGSGKELSSDSVWTNTGRVSFTPSTLFGKVVTDATVTHNEVESADTGFIEIENVIKFSVDLMGAIRHFELKSTGSIYSGKTLAYQLSGIAYLSVDRRMCISCPEIHEPKTAYANPRMCEAFVDFKKIDIRK